MSILDSLSRTESAGNFAAQNSEAGSSGRSGHFGRLQFGRDRLDDAVRAGVLPEGITPEQFMASPELQQRTEQWHLDDMRSQAERMGLTQYIGQEVGGIPITMDAILAMGHLGGMGGASKFLQTGGAHNPADSFGTSLADYARTHGGAGQQTTAQPAPQQPTNALTTFEQPQEPQNRLAQIQAMIPQQNMLNAADFQTQQAPMQTYGFGAGQNPFVR